MGDFGDITADETLLGLIGVSASEMGRGGTAPADVTIGTTPAVPALRFSATNQTIDFSFIIRQDWDFSVNPSFALLCNLVTNETNLDQINWTFDYVVTRPGTTGNNLAKTSTQLTWSTVLTTALGLTAPDQYVSIVTIDRDDASNPIASGAVQIGGALHLTNTDDVSSIDVSAAELVYTKVY